MVHKASRTAIGASSLDPASLAATERVCASSTSRHARRHQHGRRAHDAETILATPSNREARLHRLREARHLREHVEDNPFMAGASTDRRARRGRQRRHFRPGVVRAVLASMSPDDDPRRSRRPSSHLVQDHPVGELVAREAASASVGMGIVDLSLAPLLRSDSAPRSSRRWSRPLGARAHSRTRAAQRRCQEGGAMGTSSIGGLSGAFIRQRGRRHDPRRRVWRTLDREARAMTSVCSVGLDMIAIPGDTSVETIAASSPTSAPSASSTPRRRRSPHPRDRQDRRDRLSFGGLPARRRDGRQPVGRTVFARRGGRFPAPLQSLRN